jgi:uncharacterized protein (TIGR03435 family)
MRSGCSRRQLLLGRYAQRNEDLVLVTFSGGFEADRIHEFIRRYELRAAECRCNSSSRLSLQQRTGAGARAVDRPIVDKSGLTGLFDYRLEIAANIQRAFVNRPDAPADIAPSISVALREQLGLRPETAKGRVGLLVIDNADRPAEN